MYTASLPHSNPNPNPFLSSFLHHHHHHHNYHHHHHRHHHHHHHHRRHQIYSEVRNYESPPEKYPLFGKIDKMQQLYRFNLRFLANIRIVSVFALLVLYSCDYSRLGWFYYTSVAHVVIAMYYNSHIALPGTVYLTGMSSVALFLLYITFFYCL